MSANAALGHAFAALDRVQRKAPKSQLVELHCTTTCKPRGCYEITLRFTHRPNQFQIGRFYGGPAVRRLVEQMCTLLETSGSAFITYEIIGVPTEATRLRR